MRGNFKGWWVDEAEKVILNLFSIRCEAQLRLSFGKSYNWNQEETLNKVKNQYFDLCKVNKNRVKRNVQQSAK